MTLATEPLAARPSRSERMLGPALTLGGLTAATVALHLRDPHVSHSWGVCPLYAMTGIYCPGCGGLRGVNDLTDGHLGAAASSNLLLVVAIPFAILVLARWTWVTWQGDGAAVVPGRAALGQARAGRRGRWSSGSPATCPGAGSLPEASEGWAQLELPPTLITPAANRMTPSTISASAT